MPNERHAAQMPLTTGLIGNTSRMTQLNNAGIRRNRQPTGSKAIRRELYLAPETEAALKEARMASGNLSLALYLERLVHQLQNERGTLPVLSPTLDGTEVHHSDAA
jgi:hypothetical protein